MFVQYNRGIFYRCNTLQKKYGASNCQTIPIGPIEHEVTESFFSAISPIELDAYAKALESQLQDEQLIQKTHQQQLERLRYQVKLAERQFNQVDPDNRLVAAELEKRWEDSLGELKKAEVAIIKAQKSKTHSPSPLPEEMKLIFSAIGKQLPKLWKKPILSSQQKKSFLRCLIDKVVMHRSQRDQIQTRIVSKGGETTTLLIPVPVRSLSELSFAKAMEDKIAELSQAGKTNEEIQQCLTHQGYRSPKGQELLLSTIQSIRLKHQSFQNPKCQRPRHIFGFLTIPQVAQKIQVSRFWIHDRIRNGQIKITPTRLPQYKDHLYLFPDKPETIEIFQALKEGRIPHLNF